MSIETEFLYSWPTSPSAAGLTEQAHKQIAAIIHAIQTKRQDIIWPDQVDVVWTTVDMAPVGNPDEVGIDLTFRESSDSNRPPIHQVKFRFPKLGIPGLSPEQFVNSLPN